MSLSIQEWSAGIGKEPRWYQIPAIEKMEAHLDNGRRPLLVLPTGGGKTFCSAGIARNARNLLATVHTKTLKQQTIRNVKNAQVATLQGLVVPGRAGDARRAALADVSDVFIDEAHHIVSEEWRAALPLLSHTRLFGVTATPERADGTPLGDVFNEIVVGAKYSELVIAGCLCPCDVRPPEVRRRDQRKQKVKPDAVKSYLTYGKRDDGSWRPGIYFDRTISECVSACERFNEAGVRARVVTKDTTTEEREAIFDLYSRGFLDMLLSPQALAEGFDSPRAEVCCLNRSAAHVGGYLQMVGRVLRPYAQRDVDALVKRCAEQEIEVHPSALIAKDRALLIDNTDAASVHGLPTADRIYSLEGKGIDLAPDEKDEEQESDGESPEREYAKVVEMKFGLVRDKLRDMYTDLTTQAKERDYKLGWVFHRFAEKTGIQPPRAFEAKFQSVCKHCRKRLKVGEPMLWQGTGQVFHHDCWFATISQEQLLSADDLQPEAQRLLTEIKRAAEPTDNIPF